MRKDTMTATIPCVECGEPIERKPRGPKPRHCRPCAKRIDNAKRTERRREIESDRAVVREIANNLREYVTDDMWATIEEYIAGIGVTAKDAPIVPDRMPDGAMSDTGPDEGTSTGWADLADELERRRMRAIMHDWFTDNPRWLDGVNE